MRRLLQIIAVIAACWFAEFAAKGAEIQVPRNAVAGTEITLSANGGGTLYLFGPGTAIKKDVSGDGLKITLVHAGRYTAVLDGSATTFDVVPAQTKDVAFLARPSRVPADRRDAIAGTAFLFDHNRNLVVAPTSVKFELSVAGGAAQTRTAQAKDGVAYVKLDSGRKAGAAQFVVSVGDESVRRVVQQTAADPCNLRMRAEPNKNGVLVETDPIHDCAGNPVPDGTIVTFTAVDNKGRSTVDARIKKGVARAQLPPMQNATLSVAAGVVVGNEVRWGGGM
jgi:hypothetical protein